MGIGHSEMAEKRASRKPKSPRVFGHSPRRAQTPLRAGLYARVSTQDQQTIPLQTRAMREYATRRGWRIALQVKEIGSSAVQRETGATAGGRATSGDRLGVSVEAGPLGPVRHGPAGDLPGIGASRRRLRVADGGAGSDHASRSSDDGFASRL